MFGIRIPGFLFELSKDHDINQTLFNSSSGVLFMNKQTKTSGIKNEEKYVRKTLIYLTEVPSMKSRGSQVCGCTLCSCMCKIMVLGHGL